MTNLINDTEHEVVLQSGRTLKDRSQTPSSQPNLRSHTKLAENQVTPASRGDTAIPPGEERIPHGRQRVSRADGGLGMIGVSSL